MVEDPDAGLVLLTGQGDAEAASRLVARHLPRMTALARRMLGDSAEAEDVAQDVFLKVWTQAKRWQPGAAKFETWLHRVAINACLDRLRKKRGVPLDDIDERVDPALNPEQTLAQAQTARAVDAALQTLPERQRAAIALCHYQGLTNIEAAKALDVSVEALESLLSRGRRALKEKLRHLAGAGASAIRTAQA
jgi:RNA polymerase sigma factor (sigma-70 family)